MEAFEHIVSFLGLVELNALDTEALEKTALVFLESCGIECENLVGMVTDGAAKVMVGPKIRFNTKNKD
jgi:hypothetical protein